MIPKWETASSCPVLTTTFTKKEVFQASRAIIIPNMVGMGFCAGLFSSGKIETEIFPALMAEFEKVLIQDRTTNLTVKDLHSLQIPNPNWSWPVGHPRLRAVTPACRRQVLQRAGTNYENCNSPFPSFRKGGMGGFESYFLRNPKFKYPNAKLFSIWVICILNIGACLGFRLPSPKRLRAGRCFEFRISI